MNLRLYGRVMGRFKVIMALGLIIGVGGASVSTRVLAAVPMPGRAQVFITQPGFTWGSSGRSGGANDNAIRCIRVGQRGDRFAIRPRCGSSAAVVPGNPVCAARQWLRSGTCFPRRTATCSIRPLARPRRRFRPTL